MSNKININQIQKKLKEAIKLGYGDTIELRINGEHYEIVFPKSMVKKLKWH